MALQDLTPQLRTRLSRMERAVGWFVILAAGLLLFGFGYYIYNTAERKGWFKTKALFFTFTDSATGLKVGDPVKLMGLDVGRITAMEPMPPWEFQYNMYVEFELTDPYYGYIWTEGSRAKVNTADLLGKRFLEVTKGTGGYATYIFHPLLQVPLADVPALPNASYWVLAEDIFAQRTNRIAKAMTPATNLTAIAAEGYSSLLLMNTLETRKSMTGVWNDKAARYDSYSKTNKPYWLMSDESVAITERLEKLVGAVEAALPNILNLTNQLSATLSNSSSLTSNLNIIAINARPMISNLTAATAHLDQPGALGEWLLPTNIHRQLEATIGTANATLVNANTNLSVLLASLGQSLDNLANITSNLNSQVQANTNLVSSIDKTIADADAFIQGLKHHWLLRSAFKTKPTNSPPPAVKEPLHSPKMRP